RKLPNRPVFMFGCSVRHRRRVWLDRFSSNASRWRYHMALPHDDLMHSPLHAVLRRCKLALLDATFHENVVTLLVGQGDISEVPVERQAVPVGVLLCVALAVLVCVRLPKPHIRYRHSRGEIPADWL